MKFFRELVNYDLKENDSLKAVLYQKYVLQIESLLGIPPYHENLSHECNKEDTSYNDEQMHILYQDFLLLNRILMENSMDCMFFAINFKDKNFFKEEFYQMITEEGEFPELQKGETFNVKTLNGLSIEELMNKTQKLIEENHYYSYSIWEHNNIPVPSMIVIIRENDDFLYKIRFLQKIKYPLDQKRIHQMLNGKFFMNVCLKSAVQINDAVYHFCILDIQSRVNLWKWITLKQEHEYVEHCYIHALSGII